MTTSVPQGAPETTRGSDAHDSTTTTVRKLDCATVDIIWTECHADAFRKIMGDLYGVDCLHDDDGHCRVWDLFGGGRMLDEATP